MSKIPAKYMPGKFSLASWPAWIQMVVACFAGALFGGYAASTVAVSKHEQTTQRQMRSSMMDHFMKLGGEIIRKPDVVSTNGLPAINRLGFYAIDSRYRLQQAIFCGGSFEDVRQLDFAPIGANRVGAGIADGDTLKVVARNFPNVEYLDVSHCDVAELAPIQKMKNVRVLKIMNNPLEYAELQGFRHLDSVSELWVGWPDPKLDSDSLYRNLDVRKTMLQSIAEMKNLKKLYLFDMRLRETERKILESIEVINARMN
ncbi:leucine-rich repeat domain-containing protein [Aporhodopirellula aestuarii]|uniref:Leucine-rich repeat domain-containing protein n=1 Tax=Aporhodopirellula aestuarii TaxID=2950107 RepID=A0ABT0U2T9_9BACT|nr:leucine-rich repeat domain-containing protein [Aporhodopirellula aestuarii]MCM2371209.1 leucine-rich repeat domain-containing protein [Aporhodopirellula aestuarii]